MTAVVAIMNKSGLALAAASAVTVTNGTGGYSSSKIYNTANKLFMLSKYHPVGIMVYSSAEFMQVPWELIIKLYRKNLGKKSFEAIEQYRDDFLEFILQSDNDPCRQIRTVKLGRFESSSLTIIVKPHLSWRLIA